MDRTEVMINNIGSRRILQRHARILTIRTDEMLLYREKGRELGEFRTHSSEALEGAQTFLVSTSLELWPLELKENKLLFFVFSN